MPHRRTRVSFPAGHLPRDPILVGSALVVALLLRVIGAEAIGVNFDSYEQLDATSRLLSGDTPISTIYPPGIALLMAGPFAVFPDTLATMQAVIVALSLALVALSYAGALAVTGERRTAFGFALAVAVAPAMIYHARVVLFDVVLTLLAAALILWPRLARRGFRAEALLYGLLMALAVLLKAIAVVLAPALLAVWLLPAARGRGAKPSTRGIVTALATAAAVSLAVGLALSGGEQASSLHVDFDEDLIARALVYEAFAFSDLALLVVMPAALFGFLALRRTDAGVAWAALYMSAVWPVVHAPFPFFETRYMLPALYWSLFLATVGLTRALSATALRPAARRAALTGVVALIALYAVWDGVMLARWPQTVADSDERAYRDLRPRIAAMPAGSLVVTAHGRGLRQSNRSHEYVDLVDVSIPDGNTGKNIASVIDRIHNARLAGRNVYYVYGDMEARELDIGLPGPSFAAYFAAVDDAFETREIFRARNGDFRIYEISE